MNSVFREKLHTISRQPLCNTFLEEVSRVEGSIPGSPSRIIVEKSVLAGCQKFMGPLVRIVKLVQLGKEK